MKHKKVLIFHGRGNTNQDKYACTSLLAHKLQTDNFDITFDTIDYASGMSVDDIISRYPDDYDFVIGHSAGGFVALQYAQHHSGIHKLILIAPCTTTKNFTAQFLQSIQEDFAPSEAEIFMNFHDQSIRHIDVNNNCKKIIFVFGRNDPEITSEVTNIYQKTYPNATYISLYAGHMGNSLEDGGHKIMEIYDRIFPRDII